MQFKVPQNIDLEDKIIGPLTMAQFLYLLAAGLFDYILLQFLMNTQPIVFFAIAIPIAFFAIAMAFMKVNDIPFPKFIVAAIGFMFMPKRRIWHKNLALTVQQKIEAPKKGLKPQIIKKEIDKSEIEKMAQVLDTAGWAAVRDEHLKEFVQNFDEEHHTVVTPKGATK